MDLGRRQSANRIMLLIWNLDSTSFDAKTYYEQLITTSSLPNLLKRENELLTGTCLGRSLPSTKFLSIVSFP